MIRFGRTDTSLFGRWWWTVDRWLLASLLLLIALGIVMSLAGSPAVAERIHLDSFHFVRRHLLFVIPSVAILIGFSLMSAAALRRIAAIMFVFLLAALVAVLFVGPEIKGATRWLFIGPYNFQPSEFMKPVFAVVAAWMFAEHQKSPMFPGNKIAVALFALVLGLVVLERDVGQSALISAMWFVQFFLAGASMTWISFGVVAGIGGVVGSYFLFPHVAERVQGFLNRPVNGTDQIDIALNAFRTGGLFGRGPGEGIVKNVLPDAHTDFIFAVAGEEFGLLACLALLGLFAFVVLRGLLHLLDEEDSFKFLATAGLLTQFGAQVVINVAVNLNLIPPKGMTLPFVSYGGSSLLSLAMGMGMVLAFTRRHRQRAPNLRVWAYQHHPVTGGRS